MYTVGQLVALALLGGLLVPLAAAVTLWYTHKRAQPEQKGGSRSRAHLFYRALSGALLGQVLCHTWLPASLGTMDTHLLFLMVLLGYVVLDAGESIARVWHAHSHYVTVDDDAATTPKLDDLALNAERMEEQGIVTISHLRNPNAAAQVWSLVDKASDEIKRQWMLGALFLSLCVALLGDSLLLVVLENDEAGAVTNDLLILCFYINAFSLSLALLGGMLHAKFHLTPGGRWRRWLWWWSLVGVSWSLCMLVLATGLSLWLQAERTTVIALLAHPAFLIIYGLALGVLLRLHVYYGSRRLDPHTTRRDIWLGLLVFLLAAGQAALTSFWL